MRRWQFFLCVTGLCLAALQAGCAVGRRQAGVSDVQQGRTHFESYCAACHVYDGRGVREAPPLERSSWVVGPESRLIKIVLHGVRGAMEVAGRTYDREMPGFGPVLSDTEIAALLSFVRGRFGGLSTPIEPQTVSDVRSEHQNRTEYWSVEELLSSP